MATCKGRGPRVRGSAPHRNAARGETLPHTDANVNTHPEEKATSKDSLFQCASAMRPLRRDNVLTQPVGLPSGRPMPLAHAMASPVGLQLNQAQEAAANFRQGPLQVFAGAGSGKTRVIVERVRRLIALDGIRPERILALTFTNRAAREMRERSASLFGAEAERVWFGTFHSVCARFLRFYGEPLGLPRNFVVYDDADQRTAVSRCLRDLGRAHAAADVRAWAGRINRAKQEGLASQDLPERTYDDRQLIEIYQHYEQALKQSQALDFGDLLLRTLQGLRSEPAFRSQLEQRFDQLLIDEFQDTNQVQYAIVQALAERHRCLCVVGDDDQSIYRWRGANRDNLRRFREDFAEAQVVLLEQNYRSTPEILAAANAVISRGRDREPKALHTENATGQSVCVWSCHDGAEEGRAFLCAVDEAVDAGFALSDIALFYRTHAQSRVFEELLRQANMPYRIFGGLRFYERAEIKDMLAYLRLVHLSQDDVAFLRVVNTPSRGIGKTSVERLLLHAVEHGHALLDIASNPAPVRDLSASAKRRLAAFAALISQLRARYQTHRSVTTLAADIFEESGIKASLTQEATVENQARLDNIRELMNSIIEWERTYGSAAGPAEGGRPAEAATRLSDAGGQAVSHGELRDAPDARADSVAAIEPLTAFLEGITLASEAVEGEETRGALTLMSVHSAKGLEFPVVFVAGMEHGLFPYERSGDEGDPEAFEEERRLAYVAMTRAEKLLHLSHATTRRIYGQLRLQRPSPFLEEVAALPVEQRLSEGYGFSPRRPLSRLRLTTPPGLGGYGDDMDTPPEVATYAYRQHAPSFKRFAQRLNGNRSRFDDAALGHGSPSSHAQGDAGRDPSEGTYVDYEESQLDELPFNVGAQVLHERFGSGRILHIVTATPPRARVDFDSGPRQVLLSYLRPAPS